MITIGTIEYELSEMEKQITKSQEMLSYYSECDVNMPIWMAAPSPEVFFAIMGMFNAQRKSKDIEYFLCNLMGWEYIDARENRGDATDGTYYIELKTSTTNYGRDLNIRQIRLWQDVDYYVCSYIEENNIYESKCYLLTKAEMQDEVKKHGCPTHGTREAIEPNENIEWSITVHIDSSLSQEWDNKYFYSELYNRLTQK